MKAEGGFTLVEILIVVVILGILAAIVIPQFTEASTEAKESRLMTDLQSVRQQIELYKIQHNDFLPGTQGMVDFVTALISRTDQDGVVQAAPGPGIYGPYLQKIPTNPWNMLNTVGTNGAAGAGDNTHGWEFEPATGHFCADDDKLCSDDVTPHTDL